MVLNRLTHFSVPLRIPKKTSNVPWLTRAVLSAMKMRNLAYQQYKDDKSEASWRVFKQYRNKANSLKKSEKIKYETFLADSSKTNPRGLWIYLKKKKQHRDQIMSLKTPDGLTLTEPSEQCELFCDFYSSVFRPDKGQKIPPLQHPTNLMNQLVISRVEVLKQLRKQNPNKGAGPDGIHPKITKELAPFIDDTITHFFNLSLQNEEIPSGWRKSIITPIFKGGNKEEVERYRPINQTPNLCKCLERILKDHIMAFLLASNCISPSQHGFVPRRSCISNLLLTEDRVTRFMDAGETVDIVYLDFA